jgi:hypothetical protein
MKSLLVLPTLLRKSVILNNSLIPYCVKIRCRILSCGLCENYQTALEVVSAIIVAVIVIAVNHVSSRMNDTELEYKWGLWLHYFIHIYFLLRSLV